MSYSKSNVHATDEGQDTRPTATCRSESEQEKRDLREQLFNDREKGPIEKVQLPAERITRLHGILFDLDPGKYRSGTLLPEIPNRPQEFYKSVARQWLSRHPVLDKGEVRDSGTGLHVIVQFEEPVVLQSDAERDRWTGIVEVVQSMLPIDPNQPGITAVTRPIGSTNGKNESTVQEIRPGKTVPVAEVEKLSEQMQRSPFRTVLRVLAGSDRCDPCPVCENAGCSLAGLDFVGQCYECGKVPLSELFDTVFETTE